MDDALLGMPAPAGRLLAVEHAPVTEAPETSSRPPGRPRSAEADAAILEAALQVLVRDGYRALSMEAVRTLAGVGKATLYRRFQSKAELAKAVVGHLHHGIGAPADTGSLSEDLRALRAAALAAARTTQAPLFLPRMLTDAAEEPELHAIIRATLVDPRRAAVGTILERAVARGELRKDLDLDVLIDLLAAPYLYRLLIDAGDLDGALSRSEAYLDVILHGAGREAHETPEGDQRASSRAPSATQPIPKPAMKAAPTPAGTSSTA